MLGKSAKYSAVIHVTVLAKPLDRILMINGLLYLHISLGIDQNWVEEFEMTG